MHPITAALDRALATKGQTATLRRRVGTGATFVMADIRVRLAGYATDGLEAGFRVTDSRFVTSPTPITAAAMTWPGAAGGGSAPRIGDEILVEGRVRRVMQCDNVTIGDVWVRTEGRVA